MEGKEIQQLQPAAVDRQIRRGLSYIILLRCCVFRIPFIILYAWNSFRRIIFSFEWCLILASIHAAT